MSQVEERRQERQEERRDEREEDRREDAPSTAEHDATLFMLLGTTPYLPLYWVNGFSAKGIVCRLFSPENQAHLQRLLEVHLAREPLPCMMKDPVSQCWWHFDAYLAEVKVLPEVEVTFLPTGAAWKSDASPYAPVPLRQKRRDVGQPRTRKAVLVER